jgi:hypothetical protein
VNVPVRLKRLHAVQARRRRAAEKRVAKLMASRPAPVVEEPDQPVDRPAPVVPPKPPRPAAVQRWIDGPDQPETPGYSVDPDWQGPGRTYGNPQFQYRRRRNTDWEKLQNAFWRPH